MADGVETAGARISYDEKRQAVIVALPKVNVTQQIMITADAQYEACENQVEKSCFDFLNQAEIRFNQKDELYQLIRKEKNTAVLITELNAMGLDPDLYGALLELVAAK